MIVKPMNHFGSRAEVIRLFLSGLALQIAVSGSMAAQPAHALSLVQ